MTNKITISILLTIIQLCCVSVGYDSTKLKSLHSCILKETQKVSIYDGFQSRAFFKVIYRSFEVRNKFVEAISEIESLTEEERASLLKKEMEEENKYFDFLVVLSTTEFKANDLTMKNSVWRVFLEDTSGIRIYPSDIKEIKPDQKVKLLYPGVSRFGKFYHIRFEKSGKTNIKGMNLVFSSVLGKAIFKY